MSEEQPVVDGRTREELLDHARAIAPYYTELWDPNAGGSGTVLLELFSEMTADLIERLDRVPEKHRIAFFDALGFGQLPPQSSRLPLSFQVADGVRRNVAIPAETRAVAAATDRRPEQTFEISPGDGFEATPARLDRTYSVDPRADAIFEHCGALSGGRETELFAGENLQKHHLYLGHGDLLTLEPASTIRAALETEASMEALAELIWEYHGKQAEDDGEPVEKWHRVTETLRRSRSGRGVTVEFELPETGQPTETAVANTESRWIRCRLPEGDEPRERPREELFGVEIESVGLGTGADGLLPDELIANDVPLEVPADGGDPIYPFGELPQSRDTFYLASEEAFTKRGTAVELTFEREPASLTFENQESDGDTVIVESATVPEGGYVVVHNAIDFLVGNGTTTGVHQRVLGVSEYLEPGTHGNVEVTLSRRDRESPRSFRTMLAILHHGEPTEPSDDPAFSDPYIERGKRVLETAVVDIRANGEEDGEPVAWVTFRSQDSDGMAVTVESVTVPEGGFVVILDLSASAGADRIDIGVSEYLEAGTHENVEVELFDVPGRSFQQPRLTESQWLIAMPYQDDDDDRTYDPSIGDGGDTPHPGFEFDLAYVTVEEDDSAAPPAPRVRGDPRLSWEYWNGDGWERIPGLRDRTDRLRQGGTVTFDVPEDLQSTAVTGQDGSWVRVRLVGGDYGQVRYREVDGSWVSDTSGVRPPRYAGVTIAYDVEEPLEHLVTYNNLEFEHEHPKPLAPFVGLPDEKQTLYLGFDRSLVDGPINLFFSMRDREYPDSFYPRVRWEYREGRDPERWARLDDSDGTESLTRRGIVGLVFPEDTRRSERFGRALHWIRARVSAQEFTPAPRNPPEAQVVIDDIDAVRERVVIENAGDRPVDLSGYRFDFEYDQPAAQVGRLPPGTTIAPGESIAVATGSKSVGPADVRLNYRRFVLNRDEPDTVAVLTPEEELVTAKRDPGRAELNGEREDIEERTERPPGSAAPEPCEETLPTAPPTGAPSTNPPVLRGIHPNTGWAHNVATVRGDIVGSSDGSPDQEFVVSSPPATDARVWVDERSALSERRREELLETRPDEVEAVAGSPEEPGAFWVRWTEVEDFLESGPEDRHYVLDPVAGRITFGDGVEGRIPPRGPDAIRASYRTGGGGVDGNVEADAVADLSSSLPFVDSVTNPEPGDGGADAETMTQVVRRAPGQLRDRERAVTKEDFERLARVASRDLARVRCIPAMDDAGDRRPGWVTLLIVPRSEVRKPVPSVALKQRVRRTVSDHAAASLVGTERDTRPEEWRERGPELVVRGPSYVEVTVDATLAATDVESISVFEAGVTRAVDAFLHPLSGGPAGEGWVFGELPCRSDVYTLLEGLDGVDHVEDLALTFAGDREELGVTEGGREEIRVAEGGREPTVAPDVLIFSGTHEIAARRSR